jgi:hypothetical protein
LFRGLKSIRHTKPHRAHKGDHLFTTWASTKKYFIKNSISRLIFFSNNAKGFIYI